MAQATELEKEVLINVPQLVMKTVGVKLELSMKEAGVLKAILMWIGGGPTDTLRGHTTSIINALYTVKDIPEFDYDRFVDPRNRSIHFRQGIPKGFEYTSEDSK